jgi:hypothetical protein
MALEVKPSCSSTTTTTPVECVVNCQFFFFLAAPQIFAPLS